MMGDADRPRLKPSRPRVGGAVVAVCLLVSAASGFAQTQDLSGEDHDVTGVIGFNLLGPLLGVYSGSFEIALDEKWSLFVVPTYLNVKAGFIGALIEVADVAPADYDLWALALRAGANYFLTDRAPVGLLVGAYLEPGYLHARFEGSATDGDKVLVDTAQVGAGAHVGYRLLWGPVAFTPRVGAAYQYSFTEVEGVVDNLASTARAATSHFSFVWGIDLGITF